MNLTYIFMLDKNNPTAMPGDLINIWVKCIYLKKSMRRENRYISITITKSCSHEELIGIHQNWIEKAYWRTRKNKLIKIEIEYSEYNNDYTTFRACLLSKITNRILESEPSLNLTNIENDGFEGVINILGKLRTIWPDDTNRATNTVRKRNLDDDERKRKRRRTSPKEVVTDQPASYGDLTMVDCVTTKLAPSSTLDVVNTSMDVDGILNKSPLSPKR